jgi:hypothetical protein
MNDREILAAALRWSTAYEARRAIGAEKRRNEKALKGFDEDAAFAFFTPAGREFSRIQSAANNAAKLLTPARRKEQAAMRDLAKVCAKIRSRQQQVDDASEVVDVGVRLLTC